MEVLKKVGRVVLKIVLYLGVFLLLIFAAVWSVLKFPKVQNYLVSKATTYVSKKTNTTVALGSIDISFPKAVVLRQLYLDDEKKDTLLYLENLEIDIDMLAFLDRTIEVNHLNLEGLNAHVYRTENSKKFNFQFLIDAFAKPEKKEVAVKDTSAKPWKINFETLNIAYCKASFKDAYGGTFANANITKLVVNVDELDLQKKVVRVGSIEIEKTGLFLSKTKKSIDTVAPKSSTSPWNSISVDNIQFRELSFAYNDSVSQLYLASVLKKFNLENGSIDLNREHIKCQSIGLTGSTSSFSMYGQKDSLIVEPVKKVAASTPVWRIELAQLKMIENNFEMHTDREMPVKTGMDWKHLRLTDVGANIHSLKYATDTIEATLEHLQFQDKGGFGLQKFYGQASLYKQQASLTDFLIQTNYSSISNSLSMRFDSLQTIGNPKQINVDLKKSTVAIQDLLLLHPALKKVDIIKHNSKEKFLINIDAKGNLSRMVLNTMSIETASKKTRVYAKGRVDNLSSPNKIAWDISQLEVLTKASELQSFLPNGVLPKSISLPSEFKVTAKTNGSVAKATARVYVKSNYGNAAIAGVAANLNGKFPQYSVNVATEKLDLGSLLKQKETLGILSMDAKIKGKGFDPNTANATLNTDISVVEFKKYAYKNISCQADLNSGKVDLVLDVKDSNLALALNASYVMAKNREHLIAKLDLKGADLQALHLTQDNIKLSGVTSLDMKGLSLPSLNGQVAVQNILIIKDKKSYAVDSLLFVSVNSKEKSSMNVKTSLLNAKFDGQIDISGIAAVVQQHLNKYFEMSPPQAYTSVKPQDFQFELIVNDSPLLYDLILPKLKNYTPAPIVGGFDSKNSKLWLKTAMPRIQYDNLDLRNFAFNIESDSSKIDYRLAFETFTFGEYQIDNTSISGVVANNTINTNWEIVDEGKKQRLKMASALTLFAPDKYRFNILEQGIVLDGNNWAVAKDNYIEIGGKTLYINNLILSKNTEMLKIQSAANRDEMDIVFEKFSLKNISQVVETSDSLARGIVDGNVKLKGMSGQTAFIADLKINNISFKKSYVGELTLKADNLGVGRFTVNAHLGGQGNDATLAGYMQNTPDGQQLHLKADIAKIQVTSITPFTGSQISNGHGHFAGKVNITGTSKDPNIVGNLDFVEAGMQVAYLNSYINLKNERVKFDPNGIYFSNFTLRDTLANKAILDGKITMKNFSDFHFLLNLKTDNFLAMNTTAINNKLYYGKIILDSRVNITGTPELPVIKADLTLVKGSSFTFAVPESKLSLDKGDGVVVFVNDNANINRIMTREEADTLQSTYRGLDISSNIKIDKFSTLKILVDPVAGDSLVAKGDASLSFSLDPSGKTSLTGSYALTDGSYKVTLQDLIVKEFKILPNSTIIWAGDPLDAQIDITARYTTRTTAADLMGSTRSGGDSTAFSVPTDFYVLLIMKGQLLKPELSFKLDMPMNSRSLAGGAVYSKLTTLNSTPSELNKQVFSLLLLNRFIPSGSGNAGGGASSIARSSISKMMSEELNRLSAQHIKGVELNFDLQSFNQNAANGKQQGNTQLKVGVKKQLFNERLSVQIGSNVNLEGKGNSQSNMSNLTGDVVIDYKLSKDGRYRLKGFRQNQYDGIANGVITQTGVGVMYRRDFETTRELFTSPRRKKRRNQDVSNDAQPTN